MEAIDISCANEFYDKNDYAAFIKYCLSFDKIEDTVLQVLTLKQSDIPQKSSVF